MTKILIIDGHPDPARGHFVNAVADAYAEGARSAGHDVHRINLSELDFPLLRAPKDWMAAPPAVLAPARDAMTWADHFVFAYPLWLGGMPALLKGFLEQATAAGFAIAPAENGKWTQKFKGKSARIIVTMGMPAALFRLYFQAHSLKSFERNILRFAGVAPVRDTLVGAVEALSPARRARVLTRIRALGAGAR